MKKRSTPKRPMAYYGEKQRKRMAKLTGSRAGAFTQTHAATNAGPITAGATPDPLLAGQPAKDFIRTMIGRTDAEEIQHLEKRIQDLHQQLHKAEHQPQVRVLRLIEYAGDRDAVQDQVRTSIHGTIVARHGKVNITAVTLHEYPEVLKMARVTDSVRVDVSDSQDGARPGTNANNNFAPRN